MEPAKPYLISALDKVDIKETKVSVIANTTARPISKPAEIRQELIDHLTMPVLWSQSMNYLEKEGAAATVEFGKRPLLSKMMRNKGRIAAAAGGVAGVGVTVAATILYLRKKQNS